MGYRPPQPPNVFSNAFRCAILEPPVQPLAYPAEWLLDVFNGRGPHRAAQKPYVPHLITGNKSTIERVQFAGTLLLVAITTFLCCAAFKLLQ